MNCTTQLHQLGQSLWLDNITRELLTSGTLQHYIDDLDVTGLTSNPTIFYNAIKNSPCYDQAIKEKYASGLSGEILFFELALEDLIYAADLLRSRFDATHGLDGWVSLEVSPLLANDTSGTITAAKILYKRANRPNVFIKIPGTPAGLLAIEETIFAGVPVNITLLFSREHYLAAADAYMRGIERRLAAGLNLKVGCVASLFVSRWDVAVNEHVAQPLRNRLGIAIAQQVYQSYCQLLRSLRWKKLAARGAHPQRLLWASTGSKAPELSASYYVVALAASNTINTLPEQTLLAFAKHCELSCVLRADGGNADTVLTEFTRAGVDINVLASRLQKEGAVSFSKSWQSVLDIIAIKSCY